MAKERDADNVTEWCRPVVLST